MECPKSVIDGVHRREGWHKLLREEVETEYYIGQSLYQKKNIGLCRPYIQSRQKE